MKETAQIKLLDETGFAETVIMPGDPLRAKMIAETYLENPVLVNNVRFAQGYTGFYKGRKVSVMASGMGIPSMGIYSYELFNVFGVRNIIRVGTAGGLASDIGLRDVVAGIGSHTDSGYAKQFGVKGTVAPVCSYELLSCAVDVAKELDIELRVGAFYSTDVFYNADEDVNRKWADLGAVAVEMESAGLYLNAMKYKKRALAICTVSDLPLVDGCPKCSVEERETQFTKMTEIALEVAVRI